MNKRQGAEFDIEAEARRMRAGYAREWRAKNPEKVRQQNKNYWERKARQRMEEQAAQQPTYE